MLSVVPTDQLHALAAVGGRGSRRHQAHGVYLDVVTVATVPDSYEERLTELYPGRFQHLRLLVLDAYDLMLAKLTRNADRDRGDLEYLAAAVPLEPSVLKDRYSREMRDYVAVPEREDLTLRLWIDIINETRQRRG